MKRIVLAIVGLLSALPLIAQNQQSTTPISVDAVFEQTFTGGEPSRMETMLAPDFTYTDSQGHTVDRSAFLAHLPANALQATDLPAAHVYGQVAVVTSAHDRLHQVRIWVHDNDAWRLLALHDTTLAEHATPPKNDSTDCENPCRTLPYTPKNQSERDIISSWQQLETAVTHHDSQTWAAHVADEFTLVNNNNDQVFTKSDRMQVLDRQKASNAPSAPVPLRDARMFDYGEAVVMKADHRRDTGKPIHVTRIWIKRDGRWIMAFSQQTTVQAPL